MRTPTKRDMKPIDIEFESEREYEKFKHWAECTERSKNPKMNKVHRGVNEAAEMIRKGKYKF
ncbi:hypothetical protein AJ85_17890 [Alkalihalobacillus alcalophilus ATCC 27647 = CGMCC 1.3604]|uniref:Uncharacterized protein n=1 Tax=Alkalihalobacillus alcalophilus ATCC 27647 = CGMCC 1.3604 TaxID=1218173 RepID=A0A094WLL0_ALKAL|nr:hypothetical protein [Alkalihalobacillus alcalophilus]KGA98644.1 hypothetical protein BALCAV_0203200 [Alkalihalobacillus alcalophilus ATCC 27647 = CGMCC 1.3604]MED1564282.1 hypothetical protein [Alkalihalobacillus alcalophilus]THG89407.1 hypothetical protein AJ85_17890 [Alkalihalobacillus alcalophilus ATCC 27647 = CGMCC 1.3604]